LATAAVPDGSGVTSSCAAALQSPVGTGSRERYENLGVRKQ